MNLVRVINEAGEIACRHRSLSVCAECFAATPGLVNVYETVYRWSAEGWSAAEVAQISAGQMENVTLSPGTAA